MESEERERLIDELLDNTLKEYHAAEPRPGLEGRVLATVRAQARRPTAGQWSWWPAAIACAVLLLSVTTVFLARMRHPDPTSTTKHSPVDSAPRQEPDKVIVNVNPPSSGLAQRIQSARSGQTAAAVATLPDRTPSNPSRSAQFPSPQPLSDQEVMLARYVTQFPREAALTATAETELLAQEEIEREMHLGTEVSQDSQEQNP